MVSTMLNGFQREIEKINRTEQKELQLNGLNDNIKWRLTIQNKTCLILMFNEVCSGNLQVSKVQ